MTGNMLESEVDKKLKAIEFVENAKQKGIEKGDRETKKVIEKMKTQTVEQNQIKV